MNKLTLRLHLALAIIIGALAASLTFMQPATELRLARMDQEYALFVNLARLLDNQIEEALLKMLTTQAASLKASYDTARDIEKIALYAQLQGLHLYLKALGGMPEAGKGSLAGDSVFIRSEIRALYKLFKQLSNDMQSRVVNNALNILAEQSKKLRILYDASSIEERPALYGQFLGLKLYVIALIQWFGGYRSSAEQAFDAGSVSGISFTTAAQDDGSPPGVPTRAAAPRRSRTGLPELLDFRELLEQVNKHSFQKSQEKPMDQATLDGIISTTEENLKAIVKRLREATGGE